MFFSYFGFGKPNFVIVDFSLDRVEVKKLLAAIFFHGEVKIAFATFTTQFQSLIQ